MKINKQLTSRVAMAIAVAALSGASAFADSRPANETRTRSGERQVIRRERTAAATQSRRGDDSRRERSAVSSRSRERSSSSRSSRDRGYSNDRGRSSSSHRQPYYANGRISRVNPYRGGYHVWVGGARYPFFVPHSYYNRNRFRIGLMINLGGYYNPAGYYDYYDGRSRGDLRGTVESVDYRRDTFVVRNDATGSFVTVISRDRRQNLRPGDYVEVEGAWTRSGVFTAYDVDLLDYR